MSGRREGESKEEEKIPHKKDPEYLFPSSKPRVDTVAMPKSTMKMPTKTKEELYAERKAGYKTLKKKYPELSRYKEITDLLKHTELLTGDLTGIKSIVESKLKTLTLTETAENVDMCFCVDCTGSMASYINAVLDICRGAIEENTRGSIVKNLQFAFVAYRDHPP